MLEGTESASSDPMKEATETSPEPEYTIDELAHEARIPSRTIRFYQSKGALTAPTIRGRVAYYNSSHVERLKLIASLQDRGLSIRAIRDLLSQADKGELALGEWLGLEAQLQEPWANDRPKVVTKEELESIIGEARPGIVADLLRLNLIERQADTYILRSPALLDVALRLESAGVDLETAAGASQLVRKHLHRAAAEATAYFFKRIGEGFGRNIAAGDIPGAFQALRPVGIEAVRIMFAQEMEKELRKLVESGATAELTQKARKAKKR